MTAYVLQNIVMAYNGRKVLDIPDLILRTGAVYSLIGPNGAGKTTLLNILALLTPPTTGRLWFLGVPIPMKTARLYVHRRKVALVHQNPILFSTTVYKNVETGLAFRNVEKSKRPDLIVQALDRVGLSGFTHADARGLSGGETRRAAIARALVCEPKVLLLDEPCADLDEENRKAVEKIIHDIHGASRMTVIVCTHDHDHAFRLTSRVIRLEGGRLSGEAGL